MKMQQLELPKVAAIRPAIVYELPPRATVDRVQHPQRGKCWAVWDNCESFLQLDDGTRIACKITAGGASTSETWRSCQDPEHGNVRLSIITRGTTHRRAFDREWGWGWVVNQSGSKYFEDRFEGDDGVHRKLVWNAIQAGTAAAVMREEKRKDGKYELSDEEREWTTYFLCDGSVRELRWQR